MLTRADVVKHQEGATAHVEVEPSSEIRKLAADLAGICAGVLRIPLRVRFYSPAEAGDTRATLKVAPSWLAYTGEASPPDIWINRNVATAADLPWLVSHEARHRWQNDTAEGRAEYGDAEQHFREADAERFAKAMVDALRGDRPVHFHTGVDWVFAGRTLYGKGIGLGDLVALSDGHLYRNEADRGDVRLKRLV